MPRDPIGLDPRQCPACGMIGKHPTAAQCIDSLRSRLADLEFRKTDLRGKTPAARIQRSRELPARLPVGRA